MLFHETFTKLACLMYTDKLFYLFKKQFLLDVVIIWRKQMIYKKKITSKAIFLTSFVQKDP